MAKSRKSSSRCTRRRAKSGKTYCARGRKGTLKFCSCKTARKSRRSRKGR